MDQRQSAKSGNVTSCFRTHKYHTISKAHYLCEVDNSSSSAPMLKRQRPATPPPSLSELPSVPDFSMGEPSSFNHNAKRRRTVAPQMDGNSRGMNYSDGEDDNNTDDDEDNPFDNSMVEGRDEAPSGWEERAGQYKDMNQLLHQLHLEQQSRSRYPSSSSNAHSHCTQLLHTQHNSLPHPSKQSQRISDEVSHSGEQHTSSNKTEEVWTNYEANNRCVGAFITSSSLLIQILRCLARLLGSIIRHRHRLQEHGGMDKGRD